MADAPRNLDVVQRWFQAVVTDIGGVENGAASDAAQKLIPMDRVELERVIRRSKNLTAAERMAVYANAYYTRLLECIGECFPDFRRAIGDEAFGEMALGYLQTYPSRSYTLDRLGENFANYLRETRPDLDAAENPPTETDWPDFLIDLAMLERAIEVVFDGEGTEETPPLTAEQVAMIAPETFAASRLVLAPCVKLLRFRYPVNAYYTQARRAEPEQEVPLPEPRPEWVALGRRDFVVRRYPLNEPQWMLLSALQEGRTVGEAIEAAAPSVPEMDDARFGALLREWFGQWTADGFFMSVQPG